MYLTVPSRRHPPAPHHTPRCSLTQVWHLTPLLPGVPVAVNLVRQGGSWVLVDAGVRSGPQQPHVERLLAAVRATIPAGEKLTAILCEHAGC